MTDIKPGQTALEDVEEALKDVIDPELGVNIVDLGLLYGLKYSDDDGALLIDMTLTTAACPLTDVLEEQVGKSLDGVVDEWRLNWVWMPPWGPERTRDDAKDPRRALGFNTCQSDEGRLPVSHKVTGRRRTRPAHRLLHKCRHGAPKGHLLSSR